VALEDLVQRDLAHGVRQVALRPVRRVIVTARLVTVIVLVAVIGLVPVAVRVARLMAAVGLRVSVPLVVLVFPFP
jgi:hypothetical protein